MLNTSYCLLGGQGLGSTSHKHLKSTFPKSSGNEVTGPWADESFYVFLFYIFGQGGPQKLHYEILTLLSRAFLLPSWSVFLLCDLGPTKKINLRNNLNFGSLSKHPRKQALTLLLTLTCLHVPLGCTAFRAQDCPPLWNSEGMAVQAPRNELRTPGRKRTDHVFLGKSLTQTSMSSSEKLLSFSQNWHERQTTSYPWMWSARHSTNVTYIHI